jgi:mRNA-degrading endonuclease RelE of RelBE toxin-antitoxin system
MKHFALPRFWKCYRELPSNIQKLADKNFKLLKEDTSHPSLHFKKIGSDKHLLSVRVGIGYRALGVEKTDGIYWFWIGTHADYDKLID